MTTQIEIFSIGNRGQGVGRDAQGITYFVTGAFPGDTVLVESVDTGRHREATLIEVTKPSPDREQSPCSYSKECGGCDWLGWKYSAQTKAKEGLLRHTLERFEFAPQIIHPFLAAETIWNYRTRIQLRSEGGKVGFLRKQSHEIIDVASCAVADNRLNEKLKELRSQPRPDHRQKLELGLGEEATPWVAVNQRHAAKGFTQIHREQNETLKSLVTQAVQTSGGKQVLELFCGDGNFSFAAIDSTDHWLGIEIEEECLTRAKAEAVARGLSSDRLRFVRADLLTQGVARRFVEEGYDTLILDPPRSGMGKALANFLHAGLSNIIYISCSLQSFVTDSAILKKKYALREVWGLDMFPQTRHFETVALFSRR